MEKASQDKRENNTSYQPEIQVDKPVSEKLRKYSVVVKCDAGGY